MKALFAGSFDPFTIGHQSIVERGLKIFDKLIIAVGYNEHKPGEWTAGQREKAISALYQGDPRIDVATYTDLPLISHATAVRMCCFGESEVWQISNMREISPTPTVR